MASTSWPSVGFTLLFALAAEAQESAARFDAAVVTLGPSRPPYRRLLDFDADGHVDAVGAYVNDDETRVAVAFYRNDGSGTLERVSGVDSSWTLGAPDATPDAYALGVEVGDFDGDGDDDVAVAGGQELWTFEYQGPSTSLSITDVLLGGTGHALATPDLDGDGAAERVVLLGKYLGGGQGSSGLQVHWSAGGVTEHDLSGSISVSWSLPAVADGALRMFPADTDGDADDDLVILDHDRLLLCTYEAGGITASAFVHGVASPMASAGDVDGDGDDDVVVFGASSYRVLRRTGPAAWSLEPAVAGGPAEFLFDVDGDGDLDGACCGGGTETGQYEVNDFPSTFRVALNDGSGAFAAAFELHGLGSRELAGVADLDGDGDRELVAGRCVYYPAGPLVASNAAGTAPASPAGARSVADCDGDGDPDLDFGLAGASINRGQGDFAAAPAVVDAPGLELAGPGYPGDFDGDGDPDLLVEERSAGVPVGMRLLLNNGGGGLVDAGPASVPGTTSFAFDSLAAEASRVADLDGDGDLDLVTRTLASVGSSALWRNDAGVFTEHLTLAGERVEDVRDLDQDGWADLLVALDHPSEPDVQQLFVRRGDRALAFASLDDPFGVDPEWHVDVLAGSVAVADLDGDGSPEVVLGLQQPAGYPYRKPKVLTRDLAPQAPFQYVEHELLWTIQLATDYVAALPALDARFEVTDLNGDGLADVVAAPTWNGSDETVVTWLRQDPGLTAASFGTPSVQVAPFGVLADADGDGDVDAVGERTLPGRTWHGPEAGVRRQYGAGVAGTGGMAPVLGATGPLRVGETPVVRLRGAVGASIGLISLGLSEIDVPDFPFPGLDAYVGDVILLRLHLLGGTPGVAGEGSWEAPFTIDPSMPGLRLYWQFLCWDAAHPSGFTATNGLDLLLGT